MAARNILVRISVYFSHCFLKLNAELDAVVSDFGFARVVQKEDVGKTASEVGPLRWMSPVLCTIIVFSYFNRKVLNLEYIQKLQMYGHLE